MTKKFTYFNVNGLGEAIRYILHYTGQNFEDVRLAWPLGELKNSFPFGKLPILEEEGKVLHQSLAIARYVAANTELLPSDLWQQAILYAAVLTVYDFNKHFNDFVYAEEAAEREKYKRILYDDHLDYYFSRFEKQLKENNGHFIGKLSWADFVLVGIIECSNLYFHDNLEKNYPHISALMKEIHELPGVKEYIEKRGPYVRN